MSGKEEFIEIFREKITRPGADALLDYLENKSEAVEHRWVVDSEERGEWVTLKEYPETGGKDVEWRVTAEEQGRWRTTDAAARYSPTLKRSRRSIPWPPASGCCSP